jgi:hypothetical protein
VLERVPPAAKPASDQKRARRIAATRAAMRKSVVRAQKNAAGRKRFANPQARADHSAALREAWQRPYVRKRLIKANRKNELTIYRSAEHG